MKNSPQLGPRIAIYGPTGSGKTTLGHQLGQRLGLLVIELDTLFWLPNWTQKPREQFQADVQQALDACPQGWVSIGNYHSQIGGLVLFQADTVLWLQLPFRVSFWRLFKRTVARAWTKEPLWEGNPNTESWRQSFLSKNSILLYAITSRKTHVQRTLANLQNTPHHAQVLVLRSTREVRRLIDGLLRSPETRDRS
ncbi:MAG: adenylate kinase [Chloroflexi bacterium]|nr:adenylate kinase [Chloroflexota bacterium]